jgi:nucleoside-diphosphate-sugar epimerase
VTGFNSRFWFTRGTIVRMVADTALLHAAMLAAVGLRLLLVVLFQNADGEIDLAGRGQELVKTYLHASWVLTAICLTVFYLSGFYTYGRYYQGRYKALVVTQAVALSFLLYGFFSYFFAGAIHFSRGGLLLAWFFTTVLLVGSRMWAQVWSQIVAPEREAFQRTIDSPRRVLIIGGAGYIGSALVPKLLDQGYRVRVLDVLLFGDDPIRKYLSDPNLEIVQGDFRHVEMVVKAIQDVDMVVHLGAIVGDPACSLDEDLTIDVNLSATRMLAELAKAHGVNRFVFASTCSVYGASDGILNERSLTRPVSLYGHTKLASEKVLLAMADERFAPTIVRFATIYGLSGRTRFDLVINLLAAKAKVDHQITVYGGNQWRPFVHVDDAAKAVATVLNAPRPLVANQIFNVGSNDQNHTIREIGEMIHEQVVTAELTVNDDDVDLRNYRVDFGKIRNVLGFRPSWTIQDGIEQVLEAIASGDVTDYQESRYSNVKFLTEAGTHQLARDNWARELIKTVAGG